jgi:hypothetical protein
LLIAIVYCYYQEKREGEGAGAWCITTTTQIQIQIQGAMLMPETETSQHQHQLYSAFEKNEKRDVLITKVAILGMLGYLADLILINLTISIPPIF